MRHAVRVCLVAAHFAGTSLPQLRIESSRCRQQLSGTRPSSRASLVDTPILLIRAWFCHTRKGILAPSAARHWRGAARFVVAEPRNTNIVLAAGNCILWKVRHGIIPWIQCFISRSRFLHTGCITATSSSRSHKLLLLQVNQEHYNSCPLKARQHYPIVLHVRNSFEMKAASNYATFHICYPSWPIAYERSLSPA
jgi:hypothetical protein